MQELVERAHAIHQAGDLNQAEIMYNELLNIRPDNFLIQFFLGTLYFQQGKNGLAINLLSSTLAKKPEMHEAWTNIGCAHRSENRMELALEAFNKGLAIQGPNTQSLNNIGSCFVAAGNPEPGEIALKEAIKIDPENLQAQWNLALTLLEQERWEEGWAQYEYGLMSADRLVRNFECDVWDGSKGKTVIVYGEQGMGDEIMFYSILPDLIRDSDKVIVETNPRIAGLIERSFPECDVYGTRKEEWVDWPPQYTDKGNCFKVAAGSLAQYYRKQESDWWVHDGYLKASAEKIRKAADRIGPSKKIKIGLSWVGGGKKTRKDLRSLPLEHLKPILDLDAEFFSFQYTSKAEHEVNDYNVKNGTLIQHWPEYQANNGVDSEYDDTAALVANMDMIITVPTSIMHLASGLNVPCVVLNPFESQWREGQSRPNMIWYQKQTNMLRKGKGEPWTKMVLEARDLVQALIDERANENSNQSDPRNMESVRA